MLNKQKKNVSGYAVVFKFRQRDTNQNIKSNDRTKMVAYLYNSFLCIIVGQTLNSLFERYSKVFNSLMEHHFPVHRVAHNHIEPCAQTQEGYTINQQHQQTHGLITPYIAKYYNLCFTHHGEAALTRDRQRMNVDK